MRIRLYGRRNNTGIGQHYASFCDHLRRRPGMAEIMQEIDTNDQDQWQQCVTSSESTDINICFNGANIHRFVQGQIIQWVVFETTKIDSQLLSNIQAADQVWVPSRWGQDVLIQHGINPDSIHIIPEGIDPDIYYPVPRSRGATPVRFLFVGKFELRKSCHEVLTGFAEALGNRDDVELIFKTNYFKDDPERLNRLRELIEGLGCNNITGIWQHSASREILDLYRSADVFVFPSRGEGWGLPLIEAAAMGLPVIATAWSAPKDYLADLSGSALLVNYELKPVDCPDYREHYPHNTDWGQWAVIDQDHLVLRYQQAFQHCQALQKIAQKNSEIIRNQWTWTKSVDKALVVLGWKAQT